ncbi:MAG: hypothetical protein V7776_20880 [Halopseudomonas aestusnigri]
MFKKIMIFLLLLHPIPDAISEELTAGIFSLVPWGYEVEDDVVGIMPDLIQKISEQAKLPIKLQLVPYKRLFVHSKNTELVEMICSVCIDALLSSDIALLPLEYQ